MSPRVIFCNESSVYEGDFTPVRVIQWGEECVEVWYDCNALSEDEVLEIIGEHRPDDWGDKRLIGVSMETYDDGQECQCWYQLV